MGDSFQGVSYVDVLEDVRVQHDVAGNSATMRWNSGPANAVASASVDSQTATFIRAAARRSLVHLQGDESRLGLHELGPPANEGQERFVLPSGTTKVLAKT
jgi:hypothetical protein